MAQSWLDELKWNADGLLQVIAQDASSGRVLMQAWINAEALATAQKEGRAVYWSRSRNKLWRKVKHPAIFKSLVVFIWIAMLIV